MEMYKILKLVSEKTRLNILRLLKEGEKNVSKLTGLLKLSQPTISHHLKKLEEAGLVIKRQYKRMVFYKINKKFLKDFIKKFGSELKL